MKTIIWLLISILISYGGVLVIIKIIKQSTWNEAMQIIASFFKGTPYELQCDPNYISEMNDIVRTVVGESQYQQLCKLAIYSRTMTFSNIGTPTISITVKPRDDSEHAQLENLLCVCTRRYITNYKLPENIVKCAWDTNFELKYLVLKIYYPRNTKDIQFIKSELKLDVDRIIISNSDVTDDEEDLQNE